MPEQLSKEQKAAIDNYSKEIVTLKDYVTGVRKMPGMYCAGIGNRGFESLIREVYQNAIDQILKPEVPDKSVSITYNMLTLETTVSDHGLGLPFQDMERIITKPNTSKNYIKQKYQYSSGLHGAGLKVTNALSSQLIAKSYKYDGTAMQFETKDGYPIKGTNPKPIKNPKHLQGTTITFYPALDVLGECNLDWKLVYKRCRDILIRTPIGSVCDFTAIDENNVVHHETIKNDSGIVADLIDLTTIHKKLKSGKIESINNTLIKPIHIMNDNGDMRLECAFTFDGGDDEGPDPNVRISSYCNFCETKLGNHNDGTIDGICKWFTKYMNSIYLSNGDKKSKKKSISVVSSDIRTGLVISINAAVLEPIFVGQAKEQLSNPEMEPFCREVILNGLDEWSKTNPKDLATLCKYFKDIAELRIKESSEKAKIVQKYASNVLTGYPRKFARPSEKEVDLFIVEGDSAGGSAKSARNVKTTGIFPIRGKIISAFDHSPKDFWNNEEAQGIQQILFRHPYRKDQTIDEVRWEKIIFMADGDVDGSHISSLLLRFFVRYYPRLIEDGRVYKALAPLYGVEQGKQIHYITDQLEYVKYVEKSFLKNNVIEYNHKSLSTKDLTALFMKNEDYVYELKTQVADTYGVDPKLLEFALYCYINKFKFDKVQKLLKKQFRFSTAENRKGTLIYGGSTTQRNFLIMNDQMIVDCQKIIQIMKNNISIYYTLNGNNVSLYDIMVAFEASSPSNIKRYKGLGEMDPSQLSESTMDINNRTLIRYTLEDAKEEIETIRKFESNRSKLLDFVGTVKRSDLAD